MKEKVLSFFKPRFWTVFLALFLVLWQYLYAYRGIDFEALAKIRTYFGFGLSAINWNDFFVRGISMALIWVFVALIIFLLLWLAETYVVGAHNRKVARKYVNRPKEDYAHLLKVRNTSFKNSIISVIWLSAFLILIPVGMFFLSGLMEMLRNDLVIRYLITMQESGREVDYYSLNLVIVSFLGTLPFWYLFACLDSLCLANSRRESKAARIENDHYAVPVVEPDKFEEEEDSSENDTTPPSPVI